MATAYSPSLCALISIIVLSCALWSAHLLVDARDEPQAKRTQRDFKWPNKQLNVLLDYKSLNSSERSTLARIFDQIERKTCVKIHRLPSESMNPFDPNNKQLLQLSEELRNFVYIFKSPQFNAHNRHPSIGLSSLGCVRQGRQSLVLTDLAFKWPALVLRYHLMRTLGVDSIERPDGQVRRLLNVLPLSQKISGDDMGAAKLQPASGGLKSILSSESFVPKPELWALSANLGQKPAGQIGQSHRVGQSINWDEGEEELLHEDDISKVKQLYECPELQNRLSVGPILESPTQVTSPVSTIADSFGDIRSLEPNSLLEQQEIAAPTRGTSTTRLTSELDAKLGEAEESLKEVIEAAEKNGEDNVDAKLIDEAAKHIVDYLLADAAQDPNQLPLERPAVTTLAPTTTSEPTTTTTTPAPATSTEAATTKPAEGQSCDLKAIDGSCPAKRQERSTTTATDPPIDKQEKPMLLKLDEFHAQDPNLQQANQMKLSQLNADNLATYRLANGDFDWASWQQQQQQQSQQQMMQQQQLQQSNGYSNLNQGKSEMLISFEQANGQQQQPGNSMASLASSQVLKLCSCTCQTMAPQPASQQLVTPSPQVPAQPPTQPRLPYDNEGADNTGDGAAQQQDEARTQTYAPLASTTQVPLVAPGGQPEVIQPSDEWTSAQPASEEPTSVAPVETTPMSSTAATTEPTTTTTTTTALPSSEAVPPTTTLMPEPITTTTTTTTATTSTSAAPPPTPQPISAAATNYCDAVEWVAPNKTVYASARIVWDVDRANQNYFLCNNALNGELVPGKTHGFSCKLSSEGKSYELHNFNVLTKPEHVNLAWVERSNEAFGRTNLPVIGGHSASRDPYVVSRCLVRDENNDVVTLIGYVNSQGAGWFPFDDIQIECAQYDVLACVN